MPQLTQDVSHHFLKTIIRRAVTRILKLYAKKYIFIDSSLVYQEISISAFSNYFKYFSADSSHYWWGLLCFFPEIRNLFSGGSASLQIGSVRSLYMLEAIKQLSSLFPFTWHLCGCSVTDLTLVERWLRKEQFLTTQGNHSAPILCRSNTKGLPIGLQWCGSQGVRHGTRQLLQAPLMSETLTLQGTDRNIEPWHT